MFFFGAAQIVENIKVRECSSPLDWFRTVRWTVAPSVDETKRKITESRKKTIKINLPI